MKYILFNSSAVDYLACSKEYQSIEYDGGQTLINIMRGQCSTFVDPSLYIQITKNGIIFSGSDCSKSIIVYDLEQSGLIDKEKSDDDLLLIMQKTFRTAIRIWAQQPFTTSELIHDTKSIIFPFVFTDHRRVVIERSPNSERLEKRDIHRPLLVYKYGVEDAPRYEEYPSTKILDDAGKEYLSLSSDIIRHFQVETVSHTTDVSEHAIIHEKAHEQVDDGGFKYLSYELQFSQLTKTQKSVVINENISSPIRIEGPAGTGKTASMLLRSYHLLEECYASGREIKIMFITHNESTKIEVYNNFCLFENANRYISGKAKQQILFTTLFSYCIESLALPPTRIIERDAAEAKQSQVMLIAEATEKIIEDKFKTYRPLMSKEFNDLFDEKTTPRSVLVSLLQHEFSVQIKGRTDGSYEEYSALPPIKNAIPAISEAEKKFVYSIFHEYQNMLYISHVYDNDDITVAALAQWNAPIWRRERITSGFDYLFVDEMHLFSINEQLAFHYLTKDPEQKQIPICFALDYSQAIGDRGDTTLDYIETAFGKAEQNNYKTVFRSSPQITDFCAAISASGALMFQASYRNPYNIPTSGFTKQEETWCTIPQIFMYPDDETMIDSLQNHINQCKKELLCKNSEIAIISFEPSLLYPESLTSLSQTWKKNIFLLKDRESINMNKIPKESDPIIISNPNNVNGLEFKCVILVGVDEGRVPQTTGIGEVSANYIKYSAFNQLYLTSSRAKFRLILLGNSLHGTSPCLQYALENHRIELVE